MLSKPVLYLLPVNEFGQIQLKVKAAFLGT